MRGSSQSIEDARPLRRLRRALYCNPVEAFGIEAVKRVVKCRGVRQGIGGHLLADAEPRATAGERLLTAS